MLPSFPLRLHLLCTTIATIIIITIAIIIRGYYTTVGLLYYCIYAIRHLQVQLAAHVGSTLHRCIQGSAVSLESPRGCAWPQPPVTSAQGQGATGTQV